MLNLLALLSCILKYVGLIIDRYNVHHIHSKGAWCFSHYSYVNKEFIQLGEVNDKHATTYSHTMASHQF